MIVAATAVFKKEHRMKRILCTALCALAVVTGTAFASTDQDSHSPYDSHSAEGDSAQWGVG